MKSNGSTTKFQTRSLFYYFGRIYNCVCFFIKLLNLQTFWKVYNSTQLGQNKIMVCLDLPPTSLKYPPLMRWQTNNNSTLAQLQVLTILSITITQPPNINLNFFHYIFFLSRFSIKKLLQAMLPQAQFIFQLNGLMIRFESRTWVKFTSACQMWMSNYKVTDDFKEISGFSCPLSS